MNWTPPPGPRHWHLSRDIKPRGKCAGCDAAYWITVTQTPESVTESSHSGSDNGHCDSGGDGGGGGGE